MIDKYTFPVRTQQQLVAELKHEPTENKNKKVENETQDTSDEQGDVLPFHNSDHWTYPTGSKPSSSTPDKEWSTWTQLLISVDPIVHREFARGYEEDKFFTPQYIKVQPNEKMVISVNHFQEDKTTYFISLMPAGGHDFVYPRPK